ncbi:hypothetical protein ILUMI_22167 [Ignelater luminosus]|uniref:Transposase Tc1-like domain-containing protein n=1 Tax=Ignelater luminosus TaxID=2038154 RepID=A0A8K0CB75_IGNLU|nr:hypothetical protein ILUMI_22167 [Ignelater luminosus]
MNRPRKLRDDEAVKAVTLINEEHSQRYVTNLLGVRQSTISRTVKRCNELGSYCKIPGQGHKKSTDARNERYLMQVALRNMCSANLELSRALTAALNVTISARTVRRRLNKELDSKRPAITPLLTREHRATRLCFASEHVNWIIGNWKRFCFPTKQERSIMVWGGGGYP